MTDADKILLASRPDLATIVPWIAPGARVLDLGCGDGALLAYLWKERDAHGYGVEIDDAKVTACVKNDVNVLQMNLESGLSLFGDGSSGLPLDALMSHRPPFSGVTLVTMPDMLHMRIGSRAPGIPVS